MSLNFFKGKVGSSKQRKAPSKKLWWLLLIPLLVFVLLGIFNFVLEMEWFNEVNYTSVLWKIIFTRIAIFIITTIFSVLISYSLIYWAYKKHENVNNLLNANPSVRVARQLFLRSPKGIILLIVSFFSIMMGIFTQAYWEKIQLFIHRKSFGYYDPQFHKDIGFYLFTLPFVQIVLGLLITILIFSLMGMVIVYYLVGGITFINNKGKLSDTAKKQLAVVIGIFLLVKAVSYWFDRYSLLVNRSTNGDFVGASYTDINAYLPAKLILVAITLITAIVFFSVLFLRDMRLPLISLSLTVISMLVLGLIWPFAMQRLVVTPSAKQKESEYIARNITATRQAFNLTKENVNYDRVSAMQDEKAYGFSAADKFTINNIRLLDPTIVSQTFTQREKLKNFYRFSRQLYMDRYHVNNRLQDYVVGVRELDLNRMSPEQKNWVNIHTVYTHGNGIVLAAANKVDRSVEGEVNDDSSRGGFPIFEVSDTTTNGKKILENTLQVKQPRIYFGEILSQYPQDYAVVGTSNGGREYDYDGKYFKYDGKAGIKLNNVFQKLLLTVKEKEINFLLSDQINKDSKVIMYRNPRERVKKVAPWLTIDEDAYPVALNDGSIKWVVDGYTTMDNFPYAEKISINDSSLDARNRTAGINNVSENRVSYMRNSVKAVVDAYDGQVTLYQQDTKDPVLSAWMSIFPNVIKPHSDIPANLAEHFRYPEDIFKVQRELLTKYHVDDPGIFFDASDRWEIPIDQPVKNQNNKNQFKQPPYYVLASDITSKKPSFQLNSVYKPYGSNSENLTGYLTASSEPENYGKLTLKMLNTDSQVDGPKQVFDMMTTNSEVSKDKTLFNSSKVTFGNLLTLPLDNNNFIYATPLYIESKSDSNAVPKLARVLIYYNKRIGYKPTIEQSLVAAGIKIGSAANRVSSVIPAVSAPKLSDTAKTDKSESNYDELMSVINEVISAKNSGNLTRLDNALKKLEEVQKPDTLKK